MERFPVISSCLLELTLGKSKLKIAADSGLRFHPDAPAIALDDFLADSQANARAGVFAAAMQSLKKLENGLDVLWIDSDAIVILEVFQKQSRATPKAVIDACQKRIRDYDT